jgi:hypothetical protein
LIEKELFGEIEPGGEIDKLFEATHRGCGERSQ